MTLAKTLVVSLALLAPSMCLGQQASTLGKWTPYFRVDQQTLGDVMVAPGRVTFNNRVSLAIGSPGVAIPAYKSFSGTVQATVYPLTGDTRRTATNWPLCQNGHPRWIVLYTTYDAGIGKADLGMSLSITNPRHPTDPNTPNFAEKVCSGVILTPWRADQT